MNAVDASDERPARWLVWAQVAIFVLWTIMAAPSLFRRDWTPVMYAEADPSDTLELGTQRSLDQCKDDARL